MYKCEICNKEFKSLKALCGHQSIHKNGTVICSICGKEIYEPVYEAHLKVHEEDKECPVCGTRIHKDRKFCSKSCAAKFNNLGIKRFYGKGIKSTDKEKIKKILKDRIVICKNCNKEFKAIRDNMQFCSQKCSQEYRFKEKDKEYYAGKISRQKTLKLHFLRHNENKCSICGLTSWQNKPIVLILDHIDGNPENNLPENLRLVCPNCDSQLPTYKAKNTGHGRAYRRQRYKEGKSY